MLLDATTKQRSITLIRKSAATCLAIFLLALASLGSLTEPGFAKDAAATTAKDATKKTAKKPSKPKKDVKPKKETKKPASNSKDKPNKGKPKSAKAASPCKGLTQSACAAKGCVWVKASKVNGKDRKAYCRKKAVKK